MRSRRSMQPSSQRPTPSSPHTSKISVQPRSLRVEPTALYMYPGHARPLRTESVHTVHTHIHCSSSCRSSETMSIILPLLESPGVHRRWSRPRGHGSLLRAAVRSGAGRGGRRCARGARHADTALRPPTGVRECLRASSRGGAGAHGPDRASVGGP